MQNDKSQLDTRKTQARGFRTLFFLGLVLVPAALVEILAPFFIDGLCGHLWGSVAAVANVVVWVYFGPKLQIAPVTRLMLLIPFALVLLVAVVEFAHLFHWQFSK